MPHDSHTVLFTLSQIIRAVNSDDLKPRMEKKKKKNGRRAKTSGLI